MDKVQADNYISIIRTAIFKKPFPLSNPDWGQLAVWAKDQSMTALFYTGASRYESFSQWPSSQMQMDTIAAVAAQSSRTQIFLTLYQKLLAAGLRPLVLKGLVLRQLYGELEDYRPSCDEDLFVPPEQADLCRQVLEQNGWRITSPAGGVTDGQYPHETGFDSGSNLLHLEMHTAFFASDREDLRLCNEYLAGAAGRAIPIQVHGVTLWTLDETDHYLYLFFHLAKHFKGAGVGLRQILDMMQFQKAYGGHIQWDTVRRAVEGLHSEALYGDVDAIGLCFGFTPHKLFPESHPEALLADSLDGGVYGRSSPTRNYSFNVTSSALSRNSGKGNLFWLLFPPASHIIAGWPELKDHPKRLPIVWVKRIFRFLFVRRGGKVSLSALRKGKERVSLLRLYGLLPGDRSRQKER